MPDVVRHHPAQGHRQVGPVVALQVQIGRRGLAERRRDRRGREADGRVVAVLAVDVPDEHVDLGVVPSRRKLEHLVEGARPREQAAQAPEGPATERGAGDARVLAVAGAVDSDHRDARADVDEQVGVRVVVRVVIAAGGGVWMLLLLLLFRRRRRRRSSCCCRRTALAPAPVVAHGAVEEGERLVPHRAQQEIRPGHQAVHLVLLLEDHAQPRAEEVGEAVGAAARGQDADAGGRRRVVAVVLVLVVVPTAAAADTAAPPLREAARRRAVKAPYPLLLRPVEALGLDKVQALVDLGGLELDKVELAPSGRARARRGGLELLRRSRRRRRLFARGGGTGRSGSSSSSSSSSSPLARRGRPRPLSLLLLLSLPSSLDRALAGRVGRREVDELDERPADVERDVPDALAPLVREDDRGGLPLGPVDGGGEVADGRGRGADRGAREVEALGGRRGGGGGGSALGSGSGSGRGGSSSNSSSGGGRRPLLLLLLFLLLLFSVRSVVASCDVVVVVYGQGRERRGGRGRVRRRQRRLRLRGVVRREGQVFFFLISSESARVGDEGRPRNRE